MHIQMHVYVFCSNCYLIFFFFLQIIVSALLIFYEDVFAPTFLPFSIPTFTNWTCLAGLHHIFDLIINIYHWSSAPNLYRYILFLLGVSPFQELFLKQQVIYII